MNLTKDTYEYILNFADDKEIISMLMVNKKFAQKLGDDNFFKKVLERKYPNLVKFKKENETWKHLYLRMIKYIALLNEKFDIPYLNLVDYDPTEFYNEYNNTQYIIYEALKQLSENGGNHEVLEMLLDRFIEKYKDSKLINVKMSLDDFIINAVQSGDLKTVTILLEKGADNYEMLLIEAAFSDHLNIVKFVMEQFYKRGLVSQDSVQQAFESANDEVIKNYLAEFL